MKKTEVLVKNKVLTIFSYSVITILQVIQMFIFFKNILSRNRLAPKWEVDSQLRLPCSGCSEDHVKTDSEVESGYSSEEDHD